MIYVIFARVSCSCPGSVPLWVDISVLCFIVLFSLLYSGMQFWISCTTLIGHYIGSILLLYVADFLLVNIYTLRNGLRDKELRVGISGRVADLAHFYA